MSIYENFISDEELKSITETQEIKYKMDCNELIAQGIAQGMAKGIAQGIAQGEAKGEIKRAIELAVKLIKAGKMSLEEAITFCGLDNNYKEKIKKFLFLNENK